MRVLVTGHKGFIGSHLWKHFEPLLTGPEDWLEGCDLKDGRDCRDLFRDRNRYDWYFDLVFHCAATVGGRVGIDENAAFLGANNLQLDGAMFEWALHTRPGRVVYFSSAAAYPTRLQTGRYASGRYRLLEGDLTHGYSGAPDESYGWVKLVGEVVALRVRKAGVPVTVVRPFSSYGFDQDEADYPFPAFVRRAARREDPFTVWGDGTQQRDWIHVDDLVAAILALVEHGADGPVSLGTGVGTSMDDLARLCMREAGYEAPISHREDMPVGVEHRVCDPTMLERFYVPQVSIEEGVRRALAAVSG